MRNFRDFCVTIFRITLFPFFSILYIFEVPRKYWSLKGLTLFAKLSSYYLLKLRRLPNIRNPVGLNERVQWLKLFDQDKQKIELCDKVEVKKYIDRVSSTYVKVPRTIAIVKSFDEIKHLNLPERFVVKTNHDSGGVIIVHEGDKFTQQDFNALKKGLSYDYGDISGEWAYKYIERRIFIEEFIDSPGNRVPDDYKFYCINGEVKFCHYITGRGTGSVSETLIGRNFSDLGVALHPKFKYQNLKQEKNADWDSLITAAEEIAKSFKFVRVDLYFIDGLIYFGELTFWPQSGTYRGLGQVEVEKYLGFDYHAKRPTFYD
jgi:hypothetical protein